MPTTRRKQAHAAASPSQSTLSFNNKSKQTRITKPTPADPFASKKALSEPAAAQIVEATSISTSTPEPETKEKREVESEVTIRSSPAKPRIKRSTAAAPKKDERELAAEKVTDAQLKKYWRAEEASRLAPRVHQQLVPLHEKILRHFDLSSQYGPCIGIQRLTRWKRANGLGLNPPVEVLAVLLREEDKKTSQGCGKAAYIDELAGGKVVLVE